MPNDPSVSRGVTHAASRGISAGVIAGVVFLVGQSVVTVALGGSSFGPVRLIATIALGDGALSRTYPLIGAGLVGLGINVALSAIFGLFAVAAVSSARGRAHPIHVTLLAGAAYGALLWATDDLVVASLLFPQFAAADLLRLGLVGHVLFFGLPLAAYLRATQPG